MSRNKRKNKKIIIISVVIILIAAFAVGLWFFVQYKNDSKTVEVLPVSQLSTQYWGDQSNSQGIASSNYIQELRPTSGKVITDIFVQEGDKVAIGDKLLQYDKTKMELDVESKQIAIKEADLKIDTAQKQLKKLQNTKPAPTSAPTAKPTYNPRPTPSGTPTPKPTQVPPADVTLYSRLDLNSPPYAGSGSSDDPYLFLCTDDCIMTSEFLSWLLGIGTSATPTPVPTDPPESSDTEDSSEPEATPTPRPDSPLVSPFAAVFEVREENSNYGDLISAFKLDGNDISANFQIFNTITGSNTIDSVANLFGATPDPNASANNYDSMGYTRAELNALINEKKEEIKNLQFKKKQANLNLDRANLQLKNSTVLSTVDGVVKSLIDLDTATQGNLPFMVVSGDDKYYITGVISESLLGSIKVGDSITAMSWESGGSYTAQIVSVSDYPVESGNNHYGGSGNPNSSSYEFTSVVESHDGLKNGMYLELTLNVNSGETADALYFSKPYLRDDDGGTYVMKVGINNRLVKQYLQIGKSIYGGEYLEIKSGLTVNDYVAFPNTDAAEGARVHLKGSESSLPPISGASSSPTSGDASVSSDGGVLIPREDGEDSGTTTSVSPAENPESSNSGTTDAAGNIYFKDGGGSILG